MRSDDDALAGILPALARTAVRQAAAGEPVSLPDLGDLPGALRKPAACFVTLHLSGNLRGCIGGLEAERPLAHAVCHAARNAALCDPRFMPVTPEEVPLLEIEVSVLTPMQPIEPTSAAHLRELIRPGIDGVVLAHQGLRAVYLPQVWEMFEQERDPFAAFLGSLSRKAGDWSGTIWQHRDARYQVFQAMLFPEGR